MSDETIYYRGPGSRWDRIPLGIDRDPRIPNTDLIAEWRPTQHGHLLISGSQGAGKTTLLRVILTHALAHPDRYEVRVIDLSGGLTPTLDNHPEARLASTLEDAVAMLRDLASDIPSRQRQHAFSRTRSDRPPALLLLVDDASKTLGGPDTTQTELHDDANDLLDRIILGSHDVATHLAIATHRPEDLESSIGTGLPHRAAVGPHDAAAARRILGAIQTLDGTERPVTALPVGHAAMQPAFAPDYTSTFQIYDSDQHHPVHANRR